MTKFEIGRDITFYNKDGVQHWFTIKSRTAKTITLRDDELSGTVNVHIDTYTDTVTGEQTEGLSTKAIMKRYKSMYRPDNTVFAIAYDNRIEAYTTL